ncbi:MAG: beta-L-arabinofuranosidase domain-containing protein [Edaphobacter sp.]
MSSSSHTNRFDRRHFLRSTALTAAAGIGAQMLPPALLAETTPKAPLAGLLDTFTYSDVTFEPGIHDAQLHETHNVLMGLSDDEMLKPFRVRAGQPAPGADLGGWYDAYSFAPAHAFGQWLSALSRSYAITGDDATQAKITSLIRSFREMKDLGLFFKGNRFPAYTFDKVNCGLTDAYVFAQSPQAVETLDHLTISSAPYLPGKALSRVQQAARPHKDESYTWDESYTLAENLFLAWQRTGDKKYRDLGVDYLYNGFFKPLAQGENVLPGMHAYSHLNSLNSAAVGYLALKDPVYLKAAVNGFQFIQQQSFATGGWGPDEHFVVPGQGNLGKSLAKTHSSFETPCGAYGHFKLTRYLLTATGDSRYGDSMESVMYNTILGARPLQPDGHAFYYSDYNPVGNRVFFKEKWPCCSGTITQIAADYRISTYLRDQRGVFVNLYIPSTLRWKHRGSDIQLSQQGSYPFDDRISFDVRSTQPTRFALRLRIPAWTGSGGRVSINGKPASATLKPGTFATIDRTWGANDRVELTLPMTLRLQQVDPETPKTVALLHGPVVLFLLGNPQQLSERSLLAAERTAPGQWTLKGPAGDIQLRPFTAIQDQQYSTYTQLV